MNVAVLGNGKIASDCIKELLKHYNIQIGLVVGHSKDTSPHQKLTALCEQSNIEYIETEDVNCDKIFKKLCDINPVYIFNINSFCIIGPRLLKTAQKGILNFHNGPLPKYGGLNPCSWAIINGETNYGVTWHFIDEKIDTGDILAQKMFTLNPDETAVSLILRCITEGVKLFKDVVSEIISGKVTRVPQDLKKSTYYSAKALPFGGLFPFYAKRKTLEQLSRGIYFHPITNNFFFPSCSIGKNIFMIESFDIKEANSSKQVPGTILNASLTDVNVATIDSIIKIESLLSYSKGKSLFSKASKSQNINVGNVFIGAPQKSFK